MANGQTLYTHRFLFRNRVLLCTCLAVAGMIAWSQQIFTSYASGQERSATSRAPSADAQPTGPGMVLTDRSRVYIFVGKTGLGHEHGVEGRIAQGTLDLGRTDSAGQIVFDMNSFDADTDAARRYVGLGGSTDASTRQQVNANMKGTGVLDVRRYPTAKFEIDKLAPLDGKSRRGFPNYELTGRFTLHGVTRPLKIQADAEETEDGLRVRTSFSILQTQFGIKPFSKAFGAVGVTDQLVIHGDLIVMR
ncbi:MAG: YceI family protein [Planctomycetaceae bacterium]|nr:YceI family protein [Planctomycetaceae bacterium]